MHELPPETAGADPARLVAERLAAAGLLEQQAGRLLGAHDLIVGRVGDEHPLMRTDEALARQQPERLLRGLAALALLGGASRVLLAVREDLAPALGALLRLATGGRKGHTGWARRWQGPRPAGRAAQSDRLASRTRGELRLFPPRYPLDDASLLCDLQLEQNESALVCDATTLDTIGAVVAGGVAPRRLLSVVGAVARPALLQVPVGTPVIEVARSCGAEPYRWEAWRNGALRGGQPVGVDDVIDSTTRGLLLLPRDHPLVVGETIPLCDDVRRCASSCTNCRLCTDLCPVFLNGGHLRPHLIAKAVGLGWVDNPRSSGPALAALECIDCRVCDLLCPARIRPAALVRRVRQILREQGISLQQHPSFTLAPRPERAARRLSLERLRLLLGLAACEPLACETPRSLLPERLLLAFSSSSQIEVVVGQAVSAGTRLARDAASGAQLLAPVAGTVSAIDDCGIELRAR